MISNKINVNCVSGNPLNCQKKNHKRGSKFSSWIRTVATKHDKLSTILGSHMIEGVNYVIQVVL